MVTALAQLILQKKPPIDLLNDDARIEWFVEQAIILGYNLAITDLKRL